MLAHWEASHGQFLAQVLCVNLQACLFENTALHLICTTIAKHCYKYTHEEQIAVVW